jgi:hypothetical protein
MGSDRDPKSDNRTLQLDMSDAVREALEQLADTFEASALEPEKLGVEILRLARSPWERATLRGSDGDYRSAAAIIEPRTTV